MTKGFLRFLRRNTIALVALFLALGGTTYAASTALGPKNSVASPQVVNGSLQTKDLSTKARKALKGNRGLRGLTGAQGAAGAKGATGAQGPAGPFPDPLTSGQTLRGTFAAQANVNGAQIRTGISFGFSLASAPTPHYIKIGDPIPVGCTGGTVAAPKANPGHFCVYEGVMQGSSANRGVVDPVDDAAPDITAEKYGAGVYASCIAVTCLVEGTWAVTAP
jgi:hypothetical protein